MTHDDEPKKRRDRSPSYPAIPLNVAVDKVRELYKLEKAYPTPIDTILTHWKYSTRSGSGAVAIAAALKFGLIEDEGSGSTRRARVSDLGLRIVRDTREESAERDQLLREAALLPPLHRELWEKYGGALPSDANLKHTLKFEYRFTDVGAQEFVREFRATISFARLAEGEGSEPMHPVDYLPQTESILPAVRMPVVREAIDNLRVYEEPRDLKPPPQLPAFAPIVLPLPIAGTSPDRWPTLLLYERLPESDWQLMLVVLDAMKPAIVAPKPAAATASAFEATVIADSDDDSVEY